MDIKNMAAKYSDYIINIRRYFHEHPEVSGKEYNTSSVIKQELDKFGIPWIPCGLETGVLATIKGDRPGRTILLRADIDALAVTEKTGVPYASKVEGVMHACGHDCHAAMLLGAAQILNSVKDELCGTVKLAFQPAEETAVGAKAMVDSGAMEGVDACFGMHAWAGLPSGTLSCEPGPRMAATERFSIDIYGRGGHSSMPHQCVDALVVTAAIVQNLQSIVSREIDPNLPAVITAGKMSAGSRFNVIAETGHIEGTARCYDPEVFAKFPEQITRIATDTAAAYRAEVKVDCSCCTEVLINDEYMSSVVKAAAAQVLGTDAIMPHDLVPGGEDFTHFAKVKPGAFAYLGIVNPTLGAVWPHHSPKFTVDESALLRGAMIYAQVALNFNDREKQPDVLG